MHSDDNDDGSSYDGSSYDDALSEVTDPQSRHPFTDEQLKLLQTRYDQGYRAPTLAETWQPREGAKFHLIPRTPKQSTKRRRSDSTTEDRSSKRPKTEISSSSALTVEGPKASSTVAGESSDLDPALDPERTNLTQALSRSRSGSPSSCLPGPNAEGAENLDFEKEHHHEPVVHDNADSKPVVGKRKRDAAPAGASLKRRRDDDGGAIRQTRKRTKRSTMGKASSAEESVTEPPAKKHKNGDQTKPIGPRRRSIRAAALPSSSSSKHVPPGSSNQDYAQAISRGLRRSKRIAARRGKS